MTFLPALNTCIAYSASGVSTYRQIYDLAPSQVTDLSARFFGTWTAITAAIRLFTAYDIKNGQLYLLTCFTLAAAVANWASEWLVYGTASWESVRFSLIVDGGTLLYMVYTAPRDR